MFFIIEIFLSSIDVFIFLRVIRAVNFARRLLPSFVVEKFLFSAFVKE